MTPLATLSERGIFARWLLWMLVLNLLWEVLQLPLYTVPPSPIPFYKAYALLHCTVGDGLIAAGIYVGAALVAGGAGRWTRRDAAWRYCCRWALRIPRIANGATCMSPPAGRMTG